jgi:PAS domain S-box-containing protein
MDGRLAINSAVLELAEEALIVRDFEDCVRFWGPGAERMYGWKSHEAVGRNLQDLLDEHLLSDDCTDHSIESGEWVGKLRHRTKDGICQLVGKFLSKTIGNLLHRKLATRPMRKKWRIATMTLDL